jgi:F0F1-type ATP synthase assembly protein I
MDAGAIPSPVLLALFFRGAMFWRRCVLATLCFGDAVPVLACLLVVLVRPWTARSFAATFI